MKKFTKRFMDLLASIIFLPFVLSVLFILYPIVKLESQGPFIYKSRRIGRDMKEFTMYKIRTMKNDSPDIRNADGSTYNADNDYRVTRVGSFLRKTSIDELPQIFNVLIGNMSFVGPRPDLVSQREAYFNKKLDLSKFKVKPGITGYAQVNGRNLIEWAEKNKLDKFYAENYSFFLDIKIIIKTFAYVLLKKGINKEG